jgi:WD40 repeat protein/serine/threonine protein kinase
MRVDLAPNETLVQRLPLPLAQLYRRAHNAKTPLERHLTAFYLWEAGLKLLAAVAVVEYAERGQHDPELSERLQNLARPSVGHWWEFTRRLVPILADAGDGEFQKVRELLLGRTRDDLPRAAGLDAALREALENKPGARTTVRLTELFNRLVHYRNNVLAHAAPGQLKDDFNECMARAILAGVAEVLGRLDVLAGRRLLYVGEVRQVGGIWLVQRYELVGESARRIAALELPRAEAARLPDGERVHLLGPPPSGRSREPSGTEAQVPLGSRDLPEAEGAGEAVLRSLHPLVLYEADAEEVLFLNARRGKARTEYLCYTSGRTADRPDLGAEQRALLARVLGMAVAAEQAEHWATHSQAEEPSEPVPPYPLRRTLGEFELLSELGRGGMGVVYRAWQPSLGRQVALKKLLHVGDVRTEARFRREIRALGRVEHPNLIKVFTSGAEGDDWFYAMELVEGAALDAVCERLRTSTPSVTAVGWQTWHDALTEVCQKARQAEKPLSDPGATSELRPSGDGETKPGLHEEAVAPPAGRSYVRQVVELVRQVAKAAHALHETGIIHRDIKPGNVLVSADGKQAVLMDLGLAQLADDVEGRLTRTRQFVGTLRYASPQQVLAVGNLDRRTDVYSLGATLWELLALRPLFGATEQTPTPVLMEKIQYEEPGRLRTHHPGLARDLEAIVSRCLEKTPDRRYATAHELARDLGRYLDGEPVRARPVSGWERALKWVQRRPAQAAMWGLLLVVLVLGGIGGGVVWLWQEAVDARKQAEESRREALQARDQKAQAMEQLAQVSYVHRINLAWRDWEAGEVTRARQLLKGCERKRRSWEWHYLNRLFHQESAILRGHNGEVTDLVWSPDGHRLASAGSDRKVLVWDATRSKELFSLSGHTRFVTHVAWSPEGRRLASADFGGVVRVWDPVRGKKLFPLRGHTGWVNHLAWSPDGRRLVSVGKDGKVRIWDGVRGGWYPPLDGHHRDINHVAWSPDGRFLASAGQDRAVWFWDATTGKKLFAVRHDEPVKYVSWSHDSRRLASASDDMKVRIWDGTKGDALFSLSGHTARVSQVAWSPDGRRLASAGSDRTVRVWDPTGGKELFCLRGHTARVSQVAWSPDGRHLASADYDGMVRVWDAAKGIELLSLRGHAGGVIRVVWSPDGRRLASAGRDGTVRVWEPAGGKDLIPLLGHTYQVNRVAWSPDGRRLASAGRDGTVRVWDAAGGKELFFLRSGLGTVNRVAWRSDGRRLALAGNFGTVQVWDPEGGKKLFPLVGHIFPVNHVAWSPDGRHLASAGRDKTVRVWEGAAGKQILCLTGHTGWVWHVAWSYAGRRLASTDSDGNVRVWDAAGGKPLYCLRGHTSRVNHAAWSWDGRLASAGYGGTVRVWDPVRGKELFALSGHSGKVNHVAWSPGGRWLASASDDKTVRVWDTVRGKELYCLRGHTGWVWHVSWNPDGRHLASAGQDKTLRVWDGAAGHELLPLRGHTREVTHVAWSPDGSCLASASWDGTVRVWESILDQKTLGLRQRIWREIQAVDSEKAGEWFAAAFHLGYLIKRQPANAALYARRGYARAKLNQWDKAVADFAEANRLEPANAAYRYRLGLALWELVGRNLVHLF